MIHLCAQCWMRFSRRSRVCSRQEFIDICERSNALKWRLPKWFTGFVKMGWTTINKRFWKLWTWGWFSQLSVYESVPLSVSGGLGCQKKRKKEMDQLYAVERQHTVCCDAHYHVLSTGKALFPIFSSLEGHFIMFCLLGGHSKMYLIFSPLEGHSRGHLMFYPLEGHSRWHFIAFCPLESHSRGHFTFSPLEGHLRGHLMFSPLVGLLKRACQRVLNCVLSVTRAPKRTL